MKPRLSLSTQYKQKLYLSLFNDSLDWGGERPCPLSCGYCLEWRSSILLCAVLTLFPLPLGLWLPSLPSKLLFIQHKYHLLWSLPNTSGRGYTFCLISVSPHQTGSMVYRWVSVRSTMLDSQLVSTQSMLVLFIMYKNNYLLNACISGSSKENK